MASIPLESSHIKRFTPALFADIEGAPAFQLKAGSRRDRLRHQEIMAEEKVQHFDQASIRAETLKGLEALWSPDDFEQWEPRLRAFWDARDDWAKENENAEKPTPFDYTDFPESEIRALAARVAESWPPLRKMAVANLKFQREFPKLVASIVLVGWTGVETPVQRADGLMSLDAIDDLEREMAKREEELTGKANGNAFAELMIECTGRLFLSPSAEKNSASPPPSSTSLPTSNNGQASAAGMSKVSASSEPTPES